MPKKDYKKKNMVRKYRKGESKKYHLGKKIPFMKDPVYYFKRKLQHTFNPTVSDSIAPWVAANEGIVYSHNIKLSSLPNYSDFTNLFESYKIMGVELEFNCAATQVLSGSRNAYGSTAVVLRIKPNNDCKLLTGGDTRNDWLQRTDVKRYNFPNQHDRPLRIYQPCKMANQLTNAYPEVVTAGWIPTNNYNNDNYTVDMRMDAINGTDITNAAIVGIPSFTIVETVYMAFKGVA
jgi:hypothetical protein